MHSIAYSSIRKLVGHRFNSGSFRLMAIIDNNNNNNGVQSLGRHAVQAKVVDVWATFLRRLGNKSGTVGRS